MVVRRMSSIIAILMVIAISGFFVLCDICRAEAMVDPSPSQEQAKAADASDTNQALTDTSTGIKKTKTTKTKKSTSATTGNTTQSGSGRSDQAGSNSQSGSNINNDSDDEDVLDENAFSTPGNATLGDMIKSSGSKDFYTIRTDNDNTFYLVIDHSGNMDNVYMLSAIDENDLKEFLEEGEEESGSLVLPETVQPEESETAETTEKEPEKNRLPGIISLGLLIAGGITGMVLFRKYRRDAEAPEDDYSENMEDDGLPTVNEDEEFLE